MTAKPVSENFRVVAAGPDLTVRCDPQWCVSEDDATTRLMESAWQIAQTQRGDKLYNDSLAVCLPRTASASDIICGFTDYKHFIAQRMEPSLRARWHLQPLGVSGLLWIDEGLVLARRAAFVTTHPNLFDSVPAGCITQRVLLPSGLVDYRAQLLEEFEEECGLSRTHIVSMTPVAFFENREEAMFDVCLTLRVNARWSQIEAAMKACDEYYDPVCVPAKEIPQFIAAHRAQIIPSTIALIETYGLAPAK